MKFQLGATRRKPAAFGCGLLAAAAATAAALVLAACGGGEQVENFSAEQVVAFGDESSVITSGGAKYSVNAVVEGTSALSCADNPLWIQIVASRYALVFPQCNPNGVDSTGSAIYATPNATVADLPAQVDERLAEGGFDAKTLVTVLVGANDVIAQYRVLAAGGDEAAAIANLQESGAAVADQVNRIADLGGKVLISTIPDMGLTPFAVKEDASNAGRAATLSNLSLEFNRALRANLNNNGRQIGLVLLDERIQLIDKASNSLGFDNTTDGACSVALPRCTTNTLVTDPNSTTVPPALASATSWLWADDIHLSAGGQSSLGSLAASRAANNPF